MTALTKKAIKDTDFSRSVIAWLRRVPKGKVATYGQIAALAGKPHGARGVGWILHACAESHDLPWQRIINSMGRISFPRKSDEFKEQLRLLKRERVRITHEGCVDLSEFQWSKRPARAKRPAGAPTMFRD